MAGIDKRVEDLERRFRGAAEISEEKRWLIEELRKHLPHAEKKMAQEEAEGNFARRRALEELSG